MSIAAPTIAGSLATALQLFTNFDGSVFANAAIASVGMRKTALSAGERSVLLAGLATKYGTNTYGASGTVKYVVHIGDSITASGVGGAAWRQQQWTRGGSTWLRPVGDLYGLAGAAYKQDIDDAHGGWTTGDVRTQIASGLIKAGRVPCDIALMMIGTNNIGVSGDTNATIATDYGALLDDWQTANPGAPIYCQKLTLRGDSHDTQVIDFNANYLPTIVSDAVGRGVNAFMDDTFYVTPSFQYDPATDTLHPTTAHTVDMGDRLYAKLCTWLSEPAFTPTTTIGAVPSLLLKTSGLVGSPVDTWTNEGNKILGGSPGSFTAAGAAKPTLTTVDGLSVPLFNGSTSRMANGPVADTAIRTTEYTFFAVFRADALTGSQANGYDRAGLISEITNGNVYPFCFTTAGISGGHFSGGADKKVTPISITPGTVYVAIAWYDGTTFSLACNGATHTVAAGSVGNVSAAFQIGADYASAAFFTGAICELGGFSHNIARVRSANLTDLDTWLRSVFPSAVASGL
jgi:hypothetical protein